MHQKLTEAGVNGYEYRCIAALADRGELSQVALGSAAALDPRDVTVTVRALEARGLVTRKADPEHGRRMLVSLTEEGRKAEVRLSLVIADVQDKVFERLNSEERSMLLELLGRVGT
ncbi:MAG: MarR family transcriptional regulator [Rhizobiaceae bacterium]|nr:MarR family transcriptional regulator [Rhizobiaceae bacterium]